jgi:putative spermidine/putrescine transport system substrate-binding protein
MGTAFLIEVSKLNGGSDTNIEPGFEALKKLLPNISAVAPNPGALAALFQQGQIDISPINFNNMQLLKARGIPVAFAKPSSGTIAYESTLHIIKNCTDSKLAAAFVETAIDDAVQSELAASPWFAIPTNKKVTFGPEISHQVAKDQQDLKNTCVSHDWKQIQPLRAKWIERFNREMIP